jgi:hypothetical protein
LHQINDVLLPIPTPEAGMNSKGSIDGFRGQFMYGLVGAVLYALFTTNTGIRVVNVGMPVKEKIQLANNLGHSSTHFQQAVQRWGSIIICLVAAGIFYPPFLPSGMVLLGISAANRSIP